MLNYWDLLATKDVELKTKSFNTGELLLKNGERIIKQVLKEDAEQAMEEWKLCQNSQDIIKNKVFNNCKEVLDVQTWMINNNPSVKEDLQILLRNNQTIPEKEGAFVMTQRVIPRVAIQDKQLYLICLQFYNGNEREQVFKRKTLHSEYGFDFTKSTDLDSLMSSKIQIETDRPWVENKDKIDRLYNYIYNTRKVILVSKRRGSLEIGDLIDDDDI